MDNLLLSLRLLYLLLLTIQGQGKITKKKSINKNDNWMETNEDGLYEGDIMLVGGGKRKSDDDENLAVQNARKDGHWNQYGNGVVPYVISGTFTKDQREAIEEAFLEYHDKTCIRFVERDSSKHDYFVNITSNNQDNVTHTSCITKRGCWSSVGFSELDCNNDETKHVGQKLNLDSGCFSNSQWGINKGGPGT